MADFEITAAASSVCGWCGKQINPGDKLMNAAQFGLENPSGRRARFGHSECIRAARDASGGGAKSTPPSGGADPRVSELDGRIQALAAELKQAARSNEKQHAAAAATLQRVLTEVEALRVATTREHKFVVPDRPEITLTHAHAELPRVIQHAQVALAAPIDKRSYPYLWGPKGGGKSTAAAQVAKVLNMKYACATLNPQSPLSALFGFVTPNGTYSETEFYRMYKGGGLFCIDELDNGAPNLLSTLNGAIAQGYVLFPCGGVEMHKDFLLIATGNTDGRGPTMEYPQRQRLDAATMDRLIHVRWDYDANMEAGIALELNPKAMPWIQWVRKVRAYVDNPANGIRDGVYATPRAIIFGAQALTVPGESPLRVADERVFRGLPETLRAKILAACGEPAI